MIHALAILQTWNWLQEINFDDTTENAKANFNHGPLIVLVELFGCDSKTSDKTQQTQTKQLWNSFPMIAPLIFQGALNLGVNAS